MQAIFWVRKKCSLSAVFFLLCPFPVNFVIALTQPLTAKAFFGVFLQLLTLQYNYAASGHYVDKSRTNCSDHFPTKACNISIWVLAWSPFSSARSSSGAIVGGVGGGKRDPLRAKYTLGSTYYGHLVLRLGIFFLLYPRKLYLKKTCWTVAGEWLHLLPQLGLTNWWESKVLLYLGCCCLWWCCWIFHDDQHGFL